MKVWQRSSKPIYNKELQRLEWEKTVWNIDFKSSNQTPLILFYTVTMFCTEVDIQGAVILSIL
jgi:hypothetical protein